MFDPDPGATVVDCRRIAEQSYEVLVGDGLTPVDTTAGSNDLQVYAGIRTTSAQHSPASPGEPLVERNPAFDAGKITRSRVHLGAVVRVEDGHHHDR